MVIKNGQLVLLSSVWIEFARLACNEGVIVPRHGSQCLPYQTSGQSSPIVLASIQWKMKGLFCWKSVNMVLRIALVAATLAAPDFRGSAH